MSFNLSEISALAQAYKDSGLGETWNAKFLASVAAEGKQPRGRGVDIAADLLKKGDPRTWESWAKAKEYNEVAEKCSVLSEAQVLRDFAKRIYSGNELTERQKAFAEKLLNGATREVENIEITPEMREFLIAIRTRMNNMSPWYWGHRTGSHNRLNGIFESSLGHSHILKENLEFVRQIFKGPTELWERIPSLFGSICKAHTSNIPGFYGRTGSDKEGMVDILVVGGRSVSPYGAFMVECLVEGQVFQVNVEKIVIPKERKPRKKKTEAV